MTMSSVSVASSSRPGLFWFSSPQTFFTLAGKMTPWFFALAAVLAVFGLYIGFFVAPTDATQAAIFAWMPWIFMFMLGTFASGLIIYWIANNTITFIQQYTIMSMHGKRPDLFGNIRQGFNRKKPADDVKK